MGGNPRDPQKWSDAGHTSVAKLEGRIGIEVRVGVINSDITSG